ncbi:MAG: thiamine pyrophosphate-binding protein [Neptuniibacter sp.]
MSELVSVETEEVIPLNSDRLIEYLCQLNVRHIFGVPGGAIEPLFDAVARAKKNKQMDIVVARHEAGAAFMADGYAREANTLGVCCATTGPGATNLLTGVASAYADNIPMLVITAQTALPKFGKQALQDSSSSQMRVVTRSTKASLRLLTASCLRVIDQTYNSVVARRYDLPVGSHPG